MSIFFKIFLTEWPIKLYRNHDFSDYPLMVCYVSQQKGLTKDNMLVSEKAFFWTFLMLRLFLWLVLNDYFGAAMQAPKRPCTSLYKETPFDKAGRSGLAHSV